MIRTSWRNRRHIRPLHESDEEDDEKEKTDIRPPEGGDEGDKNLEVRRSSRIKKSPVRFGTNTVVTIERLKRNRGRRANELNG